MTVIPFQGKKPVVENQNPKLRQLDMRPLVHQGQDYIYLRDPMEVTEQAVLVPQPLAAALLFLDGDRDSSGISAAIAVRYGVRIPSEDIQKLIDALDEALLLDNQRYAEAYTQALLTYRTADFRPPSMAGSSYPDDLETLRKSLQEFIDYGPGVKDGNPEEVNPIRGLVSPHIDYSRGGGVYGRVWSQAAEAVREADLAIIFGTDHFGGEGEITLTRQNYATPFGVLPTAQDVIPDLVAVLGESIAFEGELRHRGEHSIELAAVWLHFIRNGKPCDLVPVLCGSFQPFIEGIGDPNEDATIEKFLSALNKAASKRNTVVIAAGDLSHVGPAFGGWPVDAGGRARLKNSDDKLMEHICAGDEGSFFNAIKRVEDRNNVCGLSPIYMAMRFLSPVQGLQVAYDRCLADENGTSFVSICGVLFQ
jgi:AmmeMemoRadiSam system protein B